MDYNEEFAEDLEDYIKENYEVYDRFTFDYLFRSLLQDGYDHEESKGIIIHNCALSTLVMQERIYNNYYLKISIDEKISEDLLKLRDEIFNNYFKNRAQGKENNFYRFQLNFKRNVGPTSESIRKCSPKTVEEWRVYYFKNVRSKKDIEKLGKKLYIKITEVIQAEVEEITEKDCIDYMVKLVINRTFDGYMTEIKTIYGQLQEILKVKVYPAPDEWDRLYNVDFFIKIKEKYIGIQIKPVNQGIQLSQIFKEKEFQKETHKKFTNEYGGKVFYVFSYKSGDKKVIKNKKVIDDIKKEIERLRK